MLAHHRPPPGPEYATLEELRVALGLSTGAATGGPANPAVSKLTSRSDMRISTLRDLIAAMGGELHVSGIGEFRLRPQDKNGFRRNGTSMRGTSSRSLQREVTTVFAGP